mmetsp:Transcript_35360/g.55540  ORF Transcript_35360/g.55540 Transcript_35360/m.55540 type:complete len:241 (-) Transcript_35360:2698-3420(-)
MALQQRKLLLHFDINKTLIVSDVAGGVGTEQMINSLLSEVAWGKINADTQAWELLSEEPSVCAPDESTGWMTFNEYLENILKPEKAQKRAVKTSFTEEGKIGESFRPAYERILNALALPEDVRAAAAAAAVPAPPPRRQLGRAPRPQAWQPVVRGRSRGQGQGRKVGPEALCPAALPACPAPACPGKGCPDPACRGCLGPRVASSGGRRRPWAACRGAWGCRGRKAGSLAGRGRGCRGCL